MAGILVDYGSSSDSDIEVEDVAKPNSASHPLKNPGSPKVTSILSNAHSARSVVSPQDVAARKRRRPIKKSVYSIGVFKVYTPRFLIWSIGVKPGGVYALFSDLVDCCEVGTRSVSYWHCRDRARPLLRNVAC